MCHIFKTSVFVAGLSVYAFACCLRTICVYVEWFSVREESGEWGFCQMETPDRDPLVKTSSGGR